MRRTSSPVSMRLSRAASTIWAFFLFSKLTIRGVVTYKGKLVENLHVVMAEKIVQQHELIEKMKGN